MALAFISAIPIMKKYRLYAPMWTIPVGLVFIFLLVLLTIIILQLTMEYQIIKMTNESHMLLSGGHFLLLLSMTPALIHQKLWIILIYFSQESAIYILRLIIYKLYESEGFDL